MCGRTVFRDPSVTEVGPNALIADADDLIERLDKLGRNYSPLRLSTSLPRWIYNRFFMSVEA